MQDRFLIGEIAKLFNMSAKTLRYYDEIDLFKPLEINEETGYRYYSTDQFEQLNTINYLKAVGMSLKTIKTHLEKRNIDYVLSLFEEQNKLIEDKIAELENIKLNIGRRVDYLYEVKEAKKMDTIIEKVYPERTVHTLKKEVKDNFHIELSLRELENRYNKNSTIFIGKIGVSVSKNRLKEGSYQYYDRIFLIPDDSSELVKSHLEVYPAGKYICIYFNGSHSSSSSYYKKLLKYIKKEGYEIIGNSFERTLIDFALTNNLDEYLTEIQIPVKKI